jgi:hypothetical protein
MLCLVDMASPQHTTTLLHTHTELVLLPPLGARLLLRRTRQAHLLAAARLRPVCQATQAVHQLGHTRLLPPTRLGRLLAALR